MKESLLDIIRKHAYKEGNFTLASGKQSNYYIDLRPIELHSSTLPLISYLIYERTGYLDFDSVGGIGYGAMPLIASTLFAFHNYNKSLRGFFVRDSIKSHGTAKLIEGNLKPGYKVVLVEDVCTTGQSIKRAIQAVEDHGCIVIKIVSLVDRLEGAKQLLSDYDYEPIFTLDDLRETK